jgi:hypothetical protein
MMRRILATLASALLLASVAHVTTTYTGGYGTANAWTAWTIAFAVLVGSIFSSMYFSSGQWRIALALLAFGLASEGYNFLKTGDRLISEIDRQEAPLREAITAYAEAKAKVAKLEARVAAPADTSKRLTEATASKAKADAAVISDASKPGWGGHRRNAACRQPHACRSPQGRCGRHPTRSRD